MIDQNASGFIWDKISLTDYPVDAFQRVLDYWEALRGTRLAPAWKNLDLLAFDANIVTHMCVVDILDGPPFRYRFYGSALVDLHNFELTNKTTDQIRPDNYRKLCGEQYASVLETKTPSMFVGRIKTEYDIIREHYNMRFPLSNDGERVTNILTVEKYDEDTKALRDYYRSIYP